MNLKQQREAALKAARDIAQKAKSENRSFTDDERKQIDEHLEKANQLLKQINDAEQDKGRLDAIGHIGDNDSHRDREQTKAAGSLGEWAAKHMFKRLAEVKGVRGASVAAPEWVPSKAATDTHETGDFPVFQTPVLTSFDTSIQHQLRQPPLIASLLSSGTISGNAISYFVEKPAPFEGSFATVAEGGAKPQMHMLEPDVRTESLRKIAGFIKLTDEMMEDLGFFVSEINNRLLYELAMFEEAQLLRGDGVGTNVLGLLNRSGLQTEARGNAASGDTAADTIFRAMTKVQTGSGFTADGLIIHPTDYQALRLARDANDQYFGGGYFTGQYGTSGMPEQPPVWGLRTIVSPVANVGEALVGNFRQSSTVYRKGGVRVESTNSHASDFTNNLVTVRAEERLALAVRNPAAIVKATLTPAA